MQKGLKKLNVLHSASYAENGGAQVVINNLINEAAKNKIKSYLVFINTKKTIPSCITDTNRVTFINRNLIFNIISLMTFVYKNKIDVLHSHTNSERFLMSVVSFMTGRRHIVHIHTRLEIENAYKKHPNPIKSLIVRFFRKYGTHLIIATSEIVETALESYRLNKAIIRIEPGIDFRKFKEHEKSYSRQALGIEVPRNRFLIGCSSRLEDKKGIETLIDSIIEINNVELMILGTGSKKSDYEKLCASYGLLDRVTFQDRCQKMQLFYSACDLIVVPSLDESFSLVFLEAIASRRPVVATDIKPFDFARNYVRTFKAGNNIDLEKQIVRTIQKIDEFQPPNIDLLKSRYSMQSACAKVFEMYRQSV